MNTDTYYQSTPSTRNAILRSLGSNTHKGSDNWRADIDTSNKRALAAIAARRHKQPIPTWGRRNAEAPHA